MGEKRKKIYRILGKKYRFSIYNDTDYEQVWKARLSGWLVLSVVIPVIAAVFFLFFLFIAYTPVRNLIPGYPTNSTRQKIISNAEKLDSLENAIASWEGYFNSIQSFVTGETDSIINENLNVDSLINTPGATEYTLLPEDSIFRSEIEQEEIARLSVKNKSPIFENMYLYPPLKGEITTLFDANKKYFGIDIKATTSPIVTATLDGMIIFSGWTFNDNYVVQIQHNNNLISIYKGNATVIKSVGERVNAGEAIANVGTNTNPAKNNVLHFELWQNGIPIDPTTYIHF
ncbi:MAG: M23 family metallopeptidase [Prevotellaceae bacterium]|jgi:murein DD-endopeptidase MepM/ murein hydrolase activator NlpD|nr:M23 family metallopeptidase [Prevotellaceae bacterium]